jgi:biopolymer transport protein ExbD
MGIVRPGYHLKSPKDLPEMRERLKGNSKRRSIVEELNLTSLIDMFSVLIIFLIQSFSATGEVFVAKDGITLPGAAYAKMLDRYPIVTVFSDKVVLEGFEVGDNKNINAKVEESDWNLPELGKKLSEYKQFFENVNQGAKFPGEVIVQADKGIEFLYLKRVMYSLVKLGYNNIDLAVRGEATGSYQKAANVDANLKGGKKAN